MKWKLDILTGNKDFRIHIQVSRYIPELEGSAGQDIRRIHSTVLRLGLID